MTKLASFLSKWRFRAVTAGCALWFAMLCIGRMNHPGLSIGFIWNDSHILTVSKWFATYGHWTNWLTPPRWTAPRVDGKWEWYSTFPPGVFWFHELRRWLGIEAMWGHRLIVLLWNGAAAWMFAVLALRITQSRAIAAASGALYIISCPFSTMAGGLWEHIPMLPLFGTLLAWWRWQQGLGTDGPRRVFGREFGWLVFWMLLDSMLSIQHSAMIAVIAMTGALAFAWRTRDRDEAIRAITAGMIVCVVPAVVFAARFGVLVHLVGGWREAVATFEAKASQRMGMDEVVTEHGGWGTLAMRIGLTQPRFENSLNWQGWFPALHPVAMIAATPIVGAMIALRRSKELAHLWRGLFAGAALFAASLTWVAIFPQHVRIHAFTVLMWMPGLAMVSGTLLVAPAALRRAGQSLGLVHRPFVFAIMCAAAVAIASPLAYSLRMSQGVNAVVPIVPVIAGGINDREERAAALTQGASQFASVPHIELVGGVPIAYWIDRPFRAYWKSGLSKGGRDEGAVVVCAMNERAGERAIADIACWRGLPRFFRDPSYIAVFGGPEDSQQGRIVVEPNLLVGSRLTWREAKIDRSIDGRALVCSALLRGDEVDIDVGQHPQLSVRFLGADGRELTRASSKKKVGSLESSHAVVLSAQVNAIDAGSWDQVELTVVWPKSDPVPLHIRRDSAAAIMQR